jgi:hypothetical protein
MNFFHYCGHNRFRKFKNYEEQGNYLQLIMTNYFITWMNNNENIEI